MSKLLSDEELGELVDLARKSLVDGDTNRQKLTNDEFKFYVLDLINTQKRLYAESVLDEVLVVIDKNIEASKGNLKYARDHNNSDRTIANWKGCIEGEKFIKDDVMRLRAEQRARIK